MTPWPLFDRFPRLAELPRVALRRAVTPVEPLADISDRLWIKRDDLTADPIGGNKVRALEFLLGPLPRGARILTGGSRGSTHVLATAVHARPLGMSVTAATWPQEMNDVARAVDARLDGEASRRHFANPVTAALWLTWRSWRGDHVIPPGGTMALGMLGQVNAAMELAEQISARALPMPARVVVPLGTGGTAAGLALGFAIAGLPIQVMGARVVPRIVGRASRVRRLAKQTAATIERLTGERVRSAGAVDIDVVEGVYGGAYGRPLEAATELAARLPARIRVDPTYSAKALVAAAGSARTADTLFWLTFDSRWIASRTTDIT